MESIEIPLGMETFLKFFSSAFFFIGEIYRKEDNFNEALNFYVKSNIPKTTTI